MQADGSTKVPPFEWSFSMDGDGVSRVDLDTDGEDDHRAAHEAPQGCSFAYMLLVCAPRLAMNMAWAAQWSALGPLLDSLTGDTKWLAKLIQCLGPIIGIVVYPTIGVLSDNCTSKYGRRRPFLVGGAIATILCWVLMMNADSIGEAWGRTTDEKRRWKLGLVTFCYAWMDISVNVMQVPATLLVADVAGDRQLLASSIGQMFSIVGGLAVAGYIAAFGPPHVAGKTPPFLYMLMALLAVTVVPVCYFVVETQHVVPADAAPTHLERLKSGFSAVYNSFRYLPRALGIYFVCTFLLVFGFSTYTANKGEYFGVFVMHGDASRADTCGAAPCTARQAAYNDGIALANGVIDTISNVVGLFWVAMLPFLVDAYGCRHVLLGSIVPQCCLVVLFFCKSAVINMLVVAAACGITQNTVFALQIPLIVHVIGFGETNGLGLFAGALNSANNLGQLLNTFTGSIFQAAIQDNNPWPILVGGLVTMLALAFAFFQFSIRTYAV
ncbi:Aste57867_19185 [Aphanomyces stellatus]|uniref:Aste57867_19185 protein n=1 Tax=Aphanomyces stellatus TaxID=120398 RepID=A0A485LDN9_9STRA|nr:hypothetical protein As57867_019121 [Aphanomyces stellatus]VFT95907.1 Aste57867_19185 [Aphanomyces stellatus]